MPRKAGPDAQNRIHASFRIERDLLARFRAEADARGVSAAYLAQRAFADYLDRMIPADELRLTRDDKDQP